MPFNKPLPEWNNPGTKPNQGLIDTGWKPDDKPPADVHNWWMNSSYEATKQLQEEAINKDQIGVANGVAPLGADGKVPASMVSGNTEEIENQLEDHIKNDLGHVRYVGGVAGQNALVPVISDVPVVDMSVTNPVPKTGYAFRFVKNGANNTSNVVIQINYGNGKNSLSYPLLDGQGKQLTSGAMVTGVVYTVSFSGTSFFLQGSGSGVKTVVRGSQTFTTPGTHNFTVPDGVSKITAYIFGAGGGGGGCVNEYYGGGGGGGGAFMLASINVTPGQVLPVIVGAGGKGLAGANNGSQGGYSGLSILGLNYIAGGGGGGSAGITSSSGQGGGAGSWNNNGITGVVTNNMVAPNGTVYVFSSAAPSNFLLSYSGGSGDSGKAPNYGGGGGGGPSDAQGGFAAQSNTPGAEPTTYCNVKGQKGGKGDYRGSGSNGGLAAGGGGSSSVIGKAGDGGDGMVSFYW